MLNPPSQRTSLIPSATKALPPEIAVASPGAVLVVDDGGRLRDRSPRAAADSELGAVSLGSIVPAALVQAATVRRFVHDGSTLDALWYSRGDSAPSGGLSEKDFVAMLHRLRNLVSILVASLDTEDMIADNGPVSAQVGHTRRREVDRLVEAMGSLGHAFAPSGARSFIDLELVLRRTLDSARGGAKRRGVNLRLDGARDARRGRTGDDVLISAAMQALLANALDVSAPDGEVRIHVEASPAAVTIHVEDDGPGLLPPSRGELGAPFATSKRGGIGLGLVIARRAAFVHGGELHVATRAEGQGVTASLWLPTAMG